MIRTPIRVERVEPRTHRELHVYHPIEKSDLLVIRTEVGPCPYGINVDGHFICDADDDRIIACLELPMAQSLWKVEAKPHPRPTASRTDLRLTHETASHNTFACSALTVTTDRVLSYCLIRFASTDSSEQCVALSNTCWAYLQGSSLVGFYCYLHGKHVRFPSYA